MRVLFSTLVVLCAIVASTDAFLLRRNAEQVVPSPHSHSSSSSSPSGNNPVADVFFALRQGLYNGNVSEVMSLFAPNATGEFRTVGAPGGVQKLGPDSSSWGAFFSGLFASETSLRAVFPSVCTTQLDSGNNMGSFLFTAMTAGANGYSSLGYDSIVLETDPNNKIVSYNEMLGAGSKQREQSNQTTMLDFVETFAQNLVVGQNATLLKASIADDFFIVVSHEHPVETEVIPGFIFASFMMQDWNESISSQYQLRNAYVVQDFVVFEMSEIFLFNKPHQTNMVKGFSFRARLVETPNGATPFQIVLLQGIEINKWGNP